MEQQFIVSSSPHVKSSESISSIMQDVIIALVPASLAGVCFFGIRALAVILTAIASCILSEYVFERITKRKNTTGDLSAVVTGLLLALNLPATIPLWMVIIGSAFAIVIVKQLYGGLGKNFMNPALAARCFMLVAWAGSMSSFVQPFAGVDAVSSATPLAVLKGIEQGSLPTLLQAFVGVKGGCIGETSGLALLIGFGYLLVKRVVDIRIPLFYIASFALLIYLFGNNTTQYGMAYFTLMHVLSGGLLIGALFMATDYVTTPTTFWGQIIFGIGCGVITFAIRVFGSYPEGVSFSIILMNIVTPLIERFTTPKPFGEVKKNG
ncbi:MAG: RnfABCDGE type electron transport complex subunit D [Ruminococcaceae bacterium]|nr:RnfABCDGE type electron transport complex subunit D [Oscillospiraceae bacterium]